MVDGTNQSQNTDERIATFSQDIAPYIATVVAIEDDQTDAAFADFFADVRAKRKEIEDWFDGVKEPLNAALKKLNSKQREICDPLKEVENAITTARASWFRTKQKAVDEADKKAIEETKGSGGVALLTPAPAKTVVTSGGASVGLRTQPSWRLTDDPTITAKVVENKKIKFDRSDPRLKNVPDKAFILQVGMISALIKTGDMPTGEHSIEKFDDLVSTSR